MNACVCGHESEVHVGELGCQLCACPDFIEDSFEKLVNDLAAEPDAGDYLRQQLHIQAEEFLTSCVSCARDIELLDDLYKAQSIMTDVTVWVLELKKELSKQVRATSRAKNTAGAYKR